MNEKGISEFMVSASSGNYDVLQSGMAMTFSADDSLLLSADFDNQLQFDIEIVFDDSAGDQELKITKRPEDEIIMISFNHFVSATAFGTNNPIELGMMNGKKIYFRTWISRMGNGHHAKKIDYVFYREQ